MIGSLQSPALPVLILDGSRYHHSKVVAGIEERNAYRYLPSVHLKEEEAMIKSASARQLLNMCECHSPLLSSIPVTLLMTIIMLK